jgi:hypothetical protein
VLAHVVGQPFGPVPPQHEPELERPEPPPERDLPVAVVDDLARGGGRVAQELGQDRQGLDQGAPVGDPEARAVEGGEQPLVGVGDEAVGPLQAVEQATVLGAHGGGAGHGPVDVQPRRGARRDLGHRRQRVDGQRAGGADRGHDQARHPPGGPVVGDRGRQPVGPEGEGVVDLDRAHLVGGEAPHPGALGQRRVGLGRGVDGQPVERGAGPDGPIAGRHQGAQGGRRRRVLDDPAARARRPEAVGQAQQVHHPVEHQRLDLGAGRAGLPQHPLGAEPGGHEVGQHRGPRGVGREVGVEPGVLPVGGAGHDDPVEVGQDGAEVLGDLGRVGR